MAASRGAGVAAPSSHTHELAFSWGVHLEAPLNPKKGYRCPGFTPSVQGLRKAGEGGKQGAGPPAVLGVGWSAYHPRCGSRPAGHLLESQGRLVPILACEVVIHAEVRLAAQLVPGGAVGDALDHPALGRKGRVPRPAGGTALGLRHQGAAAWAPAQGTYPGGSGHHPVGEDKEVQAD